MDSINWTSIEVLRQCVSALLKFGKYNGDYEVLMMYVNLYKEKYQHSQMRITEIIKEGMHLIANNWINQVHL
jgi:hypothetical protein